MTRSCKMVFTVYKRPIDWEKVYSENKDIVRYLLCQEEECPKTGKFHYQGYVQFFKAARFSRFQNMIDDKCHLEIAKGTTIENMEYCTKIKSSLGTVWEYGKPTSQGQRNDLIHIRDMLDKGDSMLEVAQEHFGDFVRYHRGFEKYQNMINRKNSQIRRSVEVTLILGPTGCGKTQSVLDEFGDEKVYIVEFDGPTVWWDGYIGQKVILLDDYDNNFKLPRLLRILDVYKIRLPIKGGFTWARWQKVFITMNLHKDELHSHAKTEHRNALFRRIKVTKNLWGVGTKCWGNTNPTLCIVSDLDG